MEWVKVGIGVVLMPQEKIMVGDVKPRWMRWAREMLGWHATDVEARVTWLKNVARQLGWWKAEKERARISSEKGRAQWPHGTAKEENGEARRVIGKEVQVVVERTAGVGKDIKELVGRVAKLVTRLTKVNVAVKGRRQFKRCMREMEALQEQCLREVCGQSVQFS